jgi:hypothetical protein
MGHLHGGRRQAGREVARQREQRARADASRLLLRAWRGLGRTGQIGHRPAKGPPSPARQLHDDIGRPAGRADWDEPQSLTAKRVMPIRDRDVRHQPVNDGGSLRCLGARLWPMRSWIASFTTRTGFSCAANPCARRRRRPSLLDRPHATMERSHPTSGRHATPADIVGIGTQKGSSQPSALPAIVADISLPCLVAALHQPSPIRS